MRECKCRERSIDENLRLFNLLKEGKIKAVLRLKGDMKSQNTSMRDPTLFRINLDPHPIVGKRYRRKKIQTLAFVRFCMRDRRCRGNACFER